MFAALGVSKFSRTAVVPPDTHCSTIAQVIATSADVREEERQATVYILMEVTGWPVKLKRLVVSVLKWKKIKKRWVCYENVTMRGIDTFATGAE